MSRSDYLTGTRDSPGDSAAVGGATPNGGGPPGNGHGSHGNGHGSHGNGHGSHGNGGGPPGDDPFAPAPRRNVPWYRRVGVLAVAGVVVLAGIAVVSDLPESASRSDQIQTASEVMNEINTDIHPCAYAVTQAFSMFQQVQNGSLSAAERSRVPGFMRDDQQACSYADQSVYSLATITLPGSAIGRDLGAVIRTVLVWSTSDALGAIVNLETLLAHPNAATARAHLENEEKTLASDRKLAVSEVHQAEETLRGARIPLPALPKLPAPGSVT